MEANNTIELTINVSIRQMGYGGNLSLNNTMQLNAKDFMEMCQILGQFQQLADKFKRTK